MPPPPRPDIPYVLHHSPEGQTHSDGREMRNALLPPPPSSASVSRLPRDKNLREGFSPPFSIPFLEAAVVAKADGDGEKNESKTAVLFHQSAPGGTCSILFSLPPPLAQKVEKGQCKPKHQEEREGHSPPAGGYGMAQTLGRGPLLLRGATDRAKGRPLSTLLRTTGGEKGRRDYLTGGKGGIDQTSLTHHQVGETDRMAAAARTDEGGGRSC